MIECRQASVEFDFSELLQPFSVLDLWLKADRWFTPIRTRVNMKGASRVFLLCIFHLSYYWSSVWGEPSGSERHPNRLFPTDTGDISLPHTNGRIVNQEATILTGNIHGGSIHSIKEGQPQLESKEITIDQERGNEVFTPQQHRLIEYLAHRIDQLEKHLEHSSSLNENLVKMSQRDCEFKMKEFRTEILDFTRLQLERERDQVKADIMLEIAKGNDAREFENKLLRKDFNAMINGQSKEMQASHATIQNDVDEIKTQTAECGKNIENVKQNCENLHAQIKDDLEGELSDLSEKVEFQSKDIEQNIQDIIDLKDSDESLTKQIYTVEKKVDHVTQSLIQLTLPSAAQLKGGEADIEDLKPDHVMFTPNELRSKFVVSDVYKGSRYYLSKYDKQVSSSKEAIRQCKHLDGSGRGHLAEVDDQEERDFIKNFINTRSKYPGVYVSGTDEAEGGVWIHQRTGDMVGYLDWHKGEPNNKFGIQHCALMYKGYSWRMDDNKCAGWDKWSNWVGWARFLCELPLEDESVPV